MNASMSIGSGDPLRAHQVGVFRHEVLVRPGKKLGVDPDRPRMRFFEPGSERWWKKGVRPQRDSYRERCYEAESTWRRKIPQRKFTDITETARYVRDVMETAWFQRRFPLFECCVVTYKPGSRWCCARPERSIRHNGHVEVVRGSIEMSLVGMGAVPGWGGEAVVLHELAHAVLPGAHEHDRRWVRTFCEFVGFQMGNAQKRMLMDEFRRLKIPMSPYKQIQFSPEHMQRLAACRPPKGGAK